MIPNVQKMYNDLLKQGNITRKDAAKQVQAQTGYSVVTGKPINKQLYGSFSKKDGGVIGQYGS